MNKTFIISFAAATLFFSCTKTEITPPEKQRASQLAATDIPTKGGLQARALTASVSFPGMHPCGIAVSKSGKVAVSTYEGDGADGKISVWNTMQAFINKQPSNASYLLLDPEAVAFDNNEALFISSTTGNKIYYTSNPLVKPTRFISNPNWNIPYPRGLAFDTKNNLVAVYEGWNGPSAVYMFKNPLLSPGQQPANVLISNITDPNHHLYFTGQLMGVSLTTGSLGSMLIYLIQKDRFETDPVTKNLTYVQKGVLHRFTYFTYGWMGGTGTHLKLEGKGMDVAASGTDIYYTTQNYYYTGNLNLSVAPSFTSQTNLEEICKVDTDGRTAWGVAIYQNYILVADAPENKVKVYTK